ncbi:MAG: hypothetical protein ACLR8Y_08210 [Alistipes indistinctus]
MSGLFGYKGTHKVKFVVTDTKGRTSYTNLTVKVTEGGSVGTGPEVKWTNKAGTVSYDFGTRYKITKLSDSEADPEVKITVTSQTGIVGFSVDINSTTLTPERAAGHLPLDPHGPGQPGQLRRPADQPRLPDGQRRGGQKVADFRHLVVHADAHRPRPGQQRLQADRDRRLGIGIQDHQLYVP